MSPCVQQWAVQGVWHWDFVQVLSSGGIVNMFYTRSLGADNTLNRYPHFSSADTKKLSAAGSHRWKNKKKPTWTEGIFIKLWNVVQVCTVTYDKKLTLHFSSGQRTQKSSERGFEISLINKHIRLTNRARGWTAGVFSGGRECWHLGVTVF